MHIHRTFWFNFLSGSNAPFLNFEIWRKWKILLKQLVSTTPLKPLNRISWNFVVMKDIMCRYAFLQKILIRSFWGAIYIPFFVRLPVTNAWNCHSLYTAFSRMLERGVCELAHSFFHSWSSPSTRDTHCGAFCSGAVTTCFYDLDGRRGLDSNPQPSVCGANALTHCATASV